MKSKLFDFFPIPKSLSMDSSGVAVSDKSVQFVRFEDKRDIGLEDFGEMQLPEGVIEGGSVRIPEKLTDILKELRRRYSLDLVEVSIPEEKSYLFKTTVLGENIKEIKSNLDLQIHENVPFKLSEVVFDFSIIGDVQLGQRDVVVSVLPKTVVERYLTVFHNAGFIPVSFQVESQAVAQSVVPLDNKKNVLVVNVQGEKAGFYIVSGQTVRFSSTVSIDGENTSFKMLSGNLNQREVTNRSDLFVLTREIKKILTYWRTHDGSKQGQEIQHIYLTGVVGDEVKTNDYISSNTSVGVEVGNVWQNAFSFEKSIPEMERGDSLRFSAAIGLALPNRE